MIGYHGSKNFIVRKLSHDSNGRILIIEANIDDKLYVLINFYNSNTETEQIKTFCELDQLLSNVSLDV